MLNAQSIEPPVTQFINEVLADYLRLRADAVKSVSQTVTLGDQVLSAWIATKSELELTNRTHGGLFNPLRSIAIGETTHSALVGDFLNPQGSHGQASLFLDSFLALIGIPEPAAGKWAITVEKGRIDILLRRLNPHSVVIIENKSNGAIDQTNQLYRYWHRNIHEPYPNLNGEPDFIKQRFKIVYLTPSLSKEPLGNSLDRPAKWNSIPGLPKNVPSELVRIVTLQELVKCWLTDPRVQIPETNFRLTTFLQFYFELWQ